jgi:hypothetical protein
MIMLLCAAQYVSQAQETSQPAQQQTPQAQPETPALPKAALKTNLIYDATATINLGVEFALAPKMTMDISGDLHPWVLPNGWRLTHYLVQPELRFWLKERFQGHFFAVNVLGATYNAGNIRNNFHIMGRDMSALGRYRLEGIAYGAGLGYGYAVRVARHLNIEMEIGLGYIGAEFDAYRLGEKESLYAQNSTAQYFGPTKGALNIVYLF